MSKQQTKDPSNCWHCGNFNFFEIIGSYGDITKEECGGEYGDYYDLFRCTKCRGLIVKSGHWNDGMESDDYNSELIFPKESHFDSMKLWQAHLVDLNFMKSSIEEAKKSESEPGKVSPKVGAVLSDGNKLIEKAHRSEQEPGEHAEYTLIEKKCSNITDFSKYTLYTTLEPCTSRSKGKQPCLEWITQARIQRVVIGMLDPNDDIRGLGVLNLRAAGVQVDFYPMELMNQLEGLNRAFIRDQKNRNSEDTVLDLIKKILNKLF